MLRIITIISCLCLSIVTQAQLDSFQKNSIKIDALQIAFSSNIELDYERFFKSGSSVFVSAGYSFRGLSALIRNFERWGYTGEIQYRKYLLPGIINYKTRLYLGPFVRYKFLEYKRDKTITEWVDDGNGNINEVSITYSSIDQFSSYYTGFVFGYNVHLGKNGILDLFIGAGIRVNGRVFYPEYGYLKTQKFGTLINPGYAGVLPRFGIKVGGIF